MAKKGKGPIAELGSSLRKSAWAAICESLLVVIFGILLLVLPLTTFWVLKNVFGVVLIIIGIYQCVNYFVEKGQNDIFDNSLLAGVISILIGIASIALQGDDIINFIRIVVGILLIYGALVRFNTAIKLHSAGVSAWGYVLIMAIIMLAAGIFIAFGMGAIGALQVAGAVMIISGVAGIVGDAIFINKVDEVENKLTKK